MTPSVTSNILERRHPAPPCSPCSRESLGVSVEQREKIDRTELYVADEAFFRGAPPPK